MKKIVNSILALACVAFAATSCALDKKPVGGVMEEDSFKFEYEQGLRGGIYNAMKGALSSGMVIYPDLYVDDLSLTYGATSGNNYYGIYTWHLYPTSGEVSALWSGVYARMSSINYAIWHMEEAVRRASAGSTVMTAAEVEKVKGFIGEMYFFRAWTMYRGARIFCAQPAATEADRSKQAGLPYPLAVDPDAQLPRKSLTDLLTQLNADLKVAEAAIKGSAYAPRAQATTLTTDAILAFKAQLALWLQDYATADSYATQFVNSTTYQLASSRSQVEDAWRQDDSNETILKLETLRTTMTTTGSFSEYVNSSLDINGAKVLSCAPYYVPTKRVVNLFVDMNNNNVAENGEWDAPKDWRVGVYITRPYSTDEVSTDRLRGLSGNPYKITFNSQQTATGVSMVNKFLGNRNFQVNSTSFTYHSAPKMFRLAEMYLIAAEARLKSTGDALTPLNALRAARGLEPLTGTAGATLASGYVEKDLFQEIKNERDRELIGEGERLFDLKRWDETFTRDVQSSTIIDVNTKPWFNEGSPIGAGAKPSTEPRFVWPIPLNEITNNKHLGDGSPTGQAQNQGY